MSYPLMLSSILLPDMQNPSSDTPDKCCVDSISVVEEQTASKIN